MKRQKKGKERKIQLAPKVGEIRPAVRTLYMEPYESSLHDDMKDKIVQAFNANGHQGVMDVTGLRRTQSYRLISRFGLIKGRDSERNLLSEKKREEHNLRYAKETWGWDGSDSLVLYKYQEYPEGSFFSRGKLRYRLSRVVRKYTLPQGASRKFLIDHGVKQWIAGDRVFSVKATQKKNYVCVYI
jgi:hypothetical protein